jgi:uncharacterized protein YbjT (DUF2867 family)
MVQGDVRLGDGLDRALDGVHVVVHAASSPRRRVRETELEGTRHVLNAAQRTGCHVIYVSIVGVDRSRFPYYRAKLAAEQLVERHNGPWTIQRATQFHDLLDQMLGAPVFIRTPHLAFQPVDSRDVASRLTDLVTGGPAGHAADVGGPAVMHIQELARVRRSVTGSAARLVPVPPLWLLRDFDRGHHLCPDQQSGVITWEQWLREREARIPDK